MAAGNQVTLTFAGDSDKLTRAMDNVGATAGRLKTDVGSASKAVEEHGNALGSLGEKADNSERNLIGIHDVIDGTATIMQGPGKQGIVAYIQGWADLAGGLAPLLLQMAEMNIKVLALKAGQIVGAAATGVITAAQWLWNAAMSANPIGLVVLAIAALVAAIVLAVKYHKQIAEVAVAAWNGIKSAAVAVADAVSGAFKKAFNTVADAWNNTIGRLSWSVPGWVPFIGGNTISVPHLPHFAMGGTVPGMDGAATLAILHGGEEVTRRGSVGGGRGGAVVRFEGDADGAVGTMFKRLIRDGYIVIEPA